MADPASTTLPPPDLRLTRSVAVPLAVALGVVVLVALVAGLDDRSAAFLTREPSDAVRAEGCEGVSCAYAGLLSNLGVLVWAAGAVTAALAARLTAPGHPARGLLGWAAAFTTLLLLDDMFLLHDKVADGALPRGQQLFLAAEAGLGLALAVVHRRQILAGRTLPFLVAVALIGASTVLDTIAPGNHLIEDGLKFVGIVAWTTWLALTASDAVERDPAPARRGAV